MKELVIDIVKNRFEYLVISFWMLVFVITTVHLIHHGDVKGVDWALNAFSAFSGALLGLIQGQRIGANSRKEDAAAKTTAI